MMSSKYPFDMMFGGYSDKQLMRAATEQLHHFDRDDVVELVAELVRRWKEEAE